MASRRRLRYIESDGQVFLVRRGTLWTFPDEADELDFAVEERHAADVLDARVTFCRPRLNRFPADWVYKDDVPHLPDVDPVVRQSVNASLARCVVGALVEAPDGRVLMVKSSRGFTQGMWNVPGGFIEYGEHPDRAAVREVEEETGLRVDLGPLVGVYMERFASPYFMYGFMYGARAATMDVRPEPTEIEEAQWMSPNDAYAATENPFARAAMREHLGVG